MRLLTLILVLFFAVSSYAQFNNYPKAGVCSDDVIAMNDVVWDICDGSGYPLAGTTSECFTATKYSLEAYPSNLSCTLPDSIAKHAVDKTLVHAADEIREMMSEAKMAGATDLGSEFYQAKLAEAKISLEEYKMKHANTEPCPEAVSKLSNDIDVCYDREEMPGKDYSACLDLDDKLSAAMKNIDYCRLDNGYLIEDYPVISNQ